MITQRRMVFGFIGLVCVLLVQHAAAAATWDMPTSYPERSFQTENIRRFAADVEAATKGALSIHVFSNGTLLQLPDIAGAVQTGTYPIGEVLLSEMGGANTLYAVDSLPFLATTYDEAKRLWQASRPSIEKALKSEGLTLLFAVPWPPQGLFVSHPVQSIDDLKGLRFRVYNHSSERFVELLGGKAVRVEVPNLAAAFYNGTVNAMITSPSTGARAKIGAFDGLFYEINAWLPKNAVIVNAAAFAALPAPVQAAVRTAAAEAEKRGWRESKSDRIAKTFLLRSFGMRVEQPNDRLEEQLRGLGQTLTQEWLDKVGPSGATILEAYQTDSAKTAATGDEPG